MENLNFNSDKPEDSISMIIFDHFKKKPNKLTIHDTFTPDIFIDILNLNVENSFTELIPSIDGYITNEKNLVKISEDIWCSFISLDKGTENHFVADVCFYYRDISNLQKINEIINKISDFTDFEEDELELHKLNTLVINSGSLEIERLPIGDKIEIKNYFNEKTNKSIDKLIKKINKSEKGLTIFSGENGLGKTTMAKHISTEINRMSIFIPNNMIELTINNPEFRNFIKNVGKTLLIIDDCEFLTSNQPYKLNHFTSSITQLVDGFISDTLNIHFLLIFNEDIENVDEDLLNCNSLLDSITFDYLETDVANDLYKSLGYSQKIKTPKRLIDIIKNNKSDKSKKIGF
jgi:hypothetical protein